MSSTENVFFQSLVTGKNGNVVIEVSLTPESALGLDQSPETLEVFSHLESFIARYGHLLLAHIAGGTSAAEFLTGIQIMHCQIAERAAFPTNQETQCDCDACQARRQFGKGKKGDNEQLPPDDDGVLN